jgi:NTE family protein
MRKWLCLAAITLAISAPMARTESLTPESRPRTCLVLGGGGARGAAHIGVLKILERERVPIDCIVGTSMGAIVGGLYASGYSADEIERVLKGINWGEVFKDDPIRGERPVRRKEDELRFVGGVEVGLDAGGIALPQGFVQGQQLLLLLRRLFQSTWQVEHFDRLPIPFRSVAADIVSGEKVVFAEGDLATAIRASMSVPGAFAPIRVNGRLLVDGGMVDNVPIDEARALGAERLIVVAVGANLLKEDELTSPFAIADQMLTALMQNRSRAQIATLGPRDLFIEPELGNFGSARFDLAPDAIKIGIAAGEAAAPKLRAFATDEAHYAQWQDRHELLAAPAPRVDFVRAPGVNERANVYVTNRFEKQVGKPFDAKALEKDIAVMYGEGRHESVSWRLAREDSRTGVEIDAVEKPWGPNFLRFGLELSDNFNGRSAYQALVQARFTKMNDRGGEGLARLQLGRVLNARAEFYQPWGWDGQFSLSPYLQYRAFNLPLRADPSDETFLAELHRSEFVGGVEIGWNPSSHWRLSAGLERGHEEARFQIGGVGTEAPSGNVGLARGRVQYDTLDSVTFPTSGLRLDLSTEVYDTQLGSRESADVTRLAFDGAFGGGRDHVLLGLQLASSHGGESTIGVVSKLGGLGNLSGYLADEVVGSQVALARLIYYRKISSDSQILGLPLFAGASLERGGFWNDRDDVDSDDLLTAGSVFLGADTILGPLFFGYGRADTGVDSFYLRIGTLLRSDLRL